MSGAPASIPLPPLGTLGIDPSSWLVLPAFVVPQPGGVGAITPTIPAVPGLVDLPIYGQALLVSDPFAARLTNVTAGLIQQ